jgi:sarcosine oxidase
MYRYVVIGRGLIGAAAARHLATQEDGVAVVGPDEPSDRGNHDGVFASYYDEGRMTRMVDPFMQWAVTATESIKRYADLERESGISFFTPAGYLGIGDPTSSYNARCATSGSALGAAIEHLDAATIRSRFPFLSVRADADGLVETGTAGHISPRAMVEAQTRLAERAGASLIREAASALQTTRRGVEVELASGQTVAAERALVAAGAFTEACGLSPRKLNLTVYARTVVLARIDSAMLRDLSAMPTLIHSASGAYILPPIRYPDGHHYLKIGIGTEADRRLGSLAEMQAWFKSSGSEDNRSEFTAFITELIPMLKECRHWHTDTCAVTMTSSSLPIIDFVADDRIAVAVGGNGKGAKGADEWGRIAAGLIRKSPWSSVVAREKLAFT